MTEELNVVLINRHDLEVNWLANPDFIPMQGELIIYDREIAHDGSTSALPTDRAFAYAHERFKIGDGITTVVNLPFAEETMVLKSTQILHSGVALSSIITDYLLNIDYESVLAFDTSEIVTGATSTTSVLGQAILGQMILA